MSRVPFATGALLSPGMREDPVWEVEDYVRDTESSFVNKVYTSVDKVSYQDSQTWKNISFNEAVMPCAL